MENVAEGAPTIPRSPQPSGELLLIGSGHSGVPELPEAYQSQAITALGRLRQEDRCALESSLGYLMNPKAI